MQYIYISFIEHGSNYMQPFFIILIKKMCIVSNRCHTTGDLKK